MPQRLVLIIRISINNMMIFLNNKINLIEQKVFFQNMRKIYKKLGI